MATVYLLILFLYTLTIYNVNGCIETLPYLTNSNSACSNQTSSCSVTCTENYIYYDGNSTKTYRCNDNDIWTPSVPKEGCLYKTRAIFWMRFDVNYKTSELALLCVDAHKQALVDNKDILTQQVSFYCNNNFVSVGDISINKTTSETSSFTITTVFELEIGDPSTTENNKDACIKLLEVNVNRDNLLVYGHTLECTSGTSSINKTSATVRSDVSRCPDLNTLIVDGNGDDYCVPDVPVVGAKSFKYTANISEDVTLHCDVLSGSSVTLLYWQHDNQTITLPNTKYNGSKIHSPSLTIYNITYDDAGEYICNAVGSAGTGTSPVVDLDVLARVEDIPRVSTADDNYSIIAGDDIEIGCNVNAFPAIDNVAWLRNTTGTTETVFPDNAKFYGANTTYPSLIIRSADLDDSGVYTCTATNVAGTGKSSDIQLRVLGDEPSIQLQADSYTVVLGDNVTLNCNYTAVPAATNVQWKYNGTGGLTDIVIDGNKYTGSSLMDASLTVTNISFHESGEYMCTVTNYVGTGNSSFVTVDVVGVAPIINVPQSVYSVILAENQTLGCNVSGLPKPLSVSWIKNSTSGIEPLSSSIKYQNGNVEIPSITVIDITNDDEGWYICTATNLAGTSYSEPVYLNVTGDVPHVEIGTGYTVVFGDNVTIDCYVSSHPVVTSIQWQKNTSEGPEDIVIDDGTYSGASIVNPSLTIMSTNFTHTGMYRCSAVNQVGVGYSNYTVLSVSGDIPDIAMPQTSYTVIRTDNITIPCNVNATPTVISSGWLRTISNETVSIDATNDKYEVGGHDNPSLTILNADDYDEGWYICKVENLVGVAYSEQIYLNVTGDVPKVEIVQDSYHVILGDNVTIACDINAHPPITQVFWERNVTGIFNRVTIDNVTVIGGSVTQPSITITSARFTDAGVYVCDAVNFVGEARSNATVLTVTGDPPTVSLETTQYNVIEDFNTTLQCNVSGIPEVSSVSWRYNITSGLDISNRIIGSTVDDPFVTIMSTELGDTGWYTCTATNLAGTTAGEPVYLNVTEKCTKYVPVISNAVLDCIFSIGTGGSCTLTCQDSYVFRNGDISAMYSCTGKNIWTPSLPMPICLETVPSTYLVTFNMKYKTSAVATFCETSHNQEIVNNNDNLVGQISVYCNNEFVNVGPILINSTNSTTSSFDIMTTYVVIIGNSDTSKSNLDACALILENNVNSDALLVYGSSLQCGSVTSTISKTEGSVVSRGAICPPGFSIIAGSVTCVSDKPRVGSTSPLYNVDVGDDITLNCDVTSELPVTAVFWEFTAYGSTETTRLAVVDGSRYGGATIVEASLNITDVLYSDAGVYRCLATNQAGTGEGTDIVLAVSTTASDRPQVAVLEPLYNVVLGDTITLNCNITSELPVAVVTWQKRVNDEFRKINIDGVRFHGSTASVPSLTLRETQFSDEGQYVCKATNYAGTGSSNITRLNVSGEVPVVSLESTYFTVLFGSNITLSCHVTGIPPPFEVLWFTNHSGVVDVINANLSHYDGATIGNPSLSIITVTTTDGGWYICTGTNLAGTTSSEHIYLNVTANKPVVTVPQTSYEVIAGDSITLRCEVFAYPPLLASSWSRNVTGTVESLMTDSTQFNMSDMLEPFLTVHRPNISDSGFYICQSTNDAGTTYGVPIHLNVIGAFPVVELLPSHSVLFGDNITLASSITAIPSATTISWQRKSSDVFTNIDTESSKYSGGTLTTPSLTIINATFEDEGEYKCITSNFVGARSNGTDLIVTGGIPVVHAPSTLYHVKIADNVTMLCNVSGSPAITSAGWKTNTTGISGHRHTGGTLTTPDLTISNVHSMDGGWYVCTAGNIVGPAQSAPIYLNVTGDEICSENIFPTVSFADTTCSDYNGIVCLVQCKNQYVNRNGDVRVYFTCNNNLWQPSLPPQGCIEYVYPYFEFNVQMVYTTTQIAAFCLSSHDKIVADRNATFAQQATEVCNNQFVAMGELEITEISSSTSSFTITTNYTLRSKFNIASRGDRVVCEILLNVQLKNQDIFNYTDILSCGTSQGSVSQTSGSWLPPTTEICPGGTLKITAVSETFCVSDIPSVIILKPSYTVETRDSLTIECSVESNFNITNVQWSRNVSGVITVVDASENDKFSGSSISDPSLTISNVEFSDMGLYTCTAENSLGTGSSEAVFVNVIERVRELPIITSITTPKQPTVGSTITLSCSVDEESESSLVFWLQSKNGNLEILQPFNMSNRFSGSTITNPELTINNVVNGDTGDYTCFAVNILGVSQGTPISVTVQTGGTVGQSTADDNMLSCVQTFGFLLLFATIGIALCTVIVILMFTYLPCSNSSIIRNVRQWKMSDKTSIVVIELFFSVITTCAVVGIVTILQCSDDTTDITAGMTSISILPGMVLSLLYFGFCYYMQSKRYNKITADSKEGMIPSTSPPPEDHFQVKTWRSYKTEEPSICSSEHETNDPVETANIRPIEPDIYASTFRAEPLIPKPSVMTTPRRQAVPPIGYTEYSEDRRRRRKKRKKKRRSETFDEMYEYNEEQ